MKISRERDSSYETVSEVEKFQHQYYKNKDEHFLLVKEIKHELKMAIKNEEEKLNWQRS